MPESMQVHYVWWRKENIIQSNRTVSLEYGMKIMTIKLSSAYVWRQKITKILCSLFLQLLMVIYSTSNPF